MAVIDLTHEQKNPPKVQKKHKLGANGKVVVRPAATITGIVVHQTACFFGLSQAQIKASGGDRDLALHRRGLNIACHVIAYAHGHAVHVNPFEWWVHHGNGFNATTLGLEVEGIFQGSLAKPKKSGELPLSATGLAAAKEAIDYMVVEGKKRGIVLTEVFAHRQSSSDRRSDPGEELWKQLVLGHAVKVHKLKTNVGLALPASNPRNGPGKPIPKQWDPSATAPY